ncbi:MAG: DGQHR domain-containing protein [Segetibacter sp.]
MDILKIVKFTQRGSLTGDPYSSLSERTHNPEEHYYQRIMSSDRVYAIKLFLLQQIYYQYHFEKKLITPLAIFPSSIILSCQLFPEEIERDEYINLVENDEVKDYCWVTDGEIIIPTSKQLLIVDGQHRVAGLESLIRDIDVGSLEIKIKDYKEPYIKDMPPIFFIKEILNRFSFIVTFLVDYDYYEQGTIFATVNFTQKSVDKSFYYDIFGSIQTGRTLEKLLHDLTAHLNYNIDSPLKDRIKMLGKRKGNFSQAFFIEAILPHFKKGF